MTQHRLVGYDPASERLVFSQDIPESLARQLVTFEPDDPDGYDAYRVEWGSVLKQAFGRLDTWPLGVLILARMRLVLFGPPDYFVEPSVSAPASSHTGPSHTWRQAAKVEDIDSVTRGDSRARH